MTSTWWKELDKKNKNNRVYAWTKTTKASNSHKNRRKSIEYYVTAMKLKKKKSEKIIWEKIWFQTTESVKQSHNLFLVL